MTPAATASPEHTNPDQANPDQAKPAHSSSERASKELLVSMMKLARALKHTPKLEVEPAQSYIIHVLHAKGPLRLSDLAVEVRLDVSTVSRHIRALEQLGYVARADDPDDRRVSLLSASRAGCTMLDRQFDASRGRIAHILRDWSADDVAVLQRVLVRLSHDLEQAQTEIPSR